MIINKYARAVFVITIFLTGHSMNVQAQCLICAPSDRLPGTMSCQSSTSGGKECQAQEDVCMLIGVCRRAPVLPPGNDGNAFVASSSIKIDVDPILIKQIAATHPRFAYALAKLAKNDMLSREELKLYMVPKVITLEDVERILLGESPKLTPMYKEALNKTSTVVRQQDKLTPVIYDVSFQNSRIVINAVQKAPSDPEYTKIEIDFTETNELNGEGKILKAGNWRVF